MAIEVTLRKHGARQIAHNVYRMICVFHEEKTASLTIYLHDLSFFCFGCNRSGSLSEIFKDITQGKNVYNPTKDQNEWKKISALYILERKKQSLPSDHEQFFEKFAYEDESYKQTETYKYLKERLR